MKLIASFNEAFFPSIRGEASKLKLFIFVE
jgi:hypothetical protein